MHHRPLSPLSDSSALPLYPSKKEPPRDYCVTRDKLSHFQGLTFFPPKGSSLAGSESLAQGSTLENRHINATDITGSLLFFSSHRPKESIVFISPAEKASTSVADIQRASMPISTISLSRLASISVPALLTLDGNAACAQGRSFGAYDAPKSISHTITKPHLSNWETGSRGARSAFVRSKREMR